MRLNDYTVSQFGGLNTFVKDVKTLKPGIAVDNTNWLTSKYGDHIVLRRGKAQLGQTTVNGAGKVTGLGIGLRYDGTRVPFFSHGKKLKYYDATLDDTVEIGTDILGTAADGEDVWFSKYQNLAGSMMYAGSPHSGTFKIPVASPGSAVSQGATDFRFGILRFGQGRAFAGQRYGVDASSSDKTGLYLSKIDRPLLSDYGGSLSTTINSPLGPNTDGSASTFSGTITIPAGYAFKPGSMTVTDTGGSEDFTDNGDGTLTGSFGGTGTVNYVTGAVSITYASVPPSGRTITAHYKNALYAGASGSTSYSGSIPLTGVQTAMYVSVHELGGETLTDDRNGGLVGSLGSTGTINYATGAYAVTFNHPTTGIVTVDYYQEDATDGGALDFSTGDDSTAEILRQDDGGEFMAVLPFMDVNYAIHLLKTWNVTLGTDGSPASNLPYRAIGIPYPRAAIETPDGVLLIDTSNPSEPKVRLLEIGANTNNVTIVPTPLSDALDLSVHAFDYAVGFRWGDYQIVCCQEYTNGIANAYNTVMYVRNVFSKAWDRLDYGATCLGDYAGGLLGGDAISNNVYTLFSGFDDDGSPIANH